ncbi:hypothetical protein GW17_00057615, partial [Ensete ventricosum]
RRLVAARRLDETIFGDVDISGNRRGKHLIPRADEDRDDQPRLRRFDRGSDRVGIARISNRGRRRRQARRLGEQGTKALMPGNLHLRQFDARTAHFFARRANESFARDDDMAMLIRALAIENHIAFFGMFLGHGQSRGDRVADIHRCRKPQVLTEIDRPRPWQLRAEHAGNEAGPQHAMGDDAMEHIGLRIGRIHMRRIDVAGYDGEEVDVFKP